MILKIFPLEFLRGLNWHPWLLKPFILKRGTKSKITSFLRTVLLVNLKKSSLGMQTGFRPRVHSVLEPWWLLCCFSEIQHTSASKQTYATASLYNSSSPWRQQKFHFSVKRCVFTASACSRRESIYTFCITRSLCGCLSTTRAAGFQCRIYTLLKAIHLKWNGKSHIQIRNVKNEIRYQVITF